MDAAREVDEEQGEAAGLGVEASLSGAQDVELGGDGGNENSDESGADGNAASQGESSGVGQAQGDGEQQQHQQQLDVSKPRTRTSGISTWRSMAGSRHIRYAMGNEDMRGMVATPLDSSCARPMGTGMRFFKNMQNEVEQMEQPGFMRFGSSGELDGEEEGTNPNQMYKLQATKGSMDVGCFRRTLRFIGACINCGALTDGAAEQNSYLGFGDPNRWLVTFFFWLFRKGWATVAFLSIVWYYALVVLFALFIIWAAEIDNDCVKVGGNNIGELDTRSKFMDAFSLSWNTFSTVGYGSTYPALSTEIDDKGDARCVFISFITSIEAFVGVIFAGFIGAIFFAKVSRITQHANVQFSEPLTVRFGDGVDAHGDEEGEQEEEDQDEEENPEDMAPLDKFRSMAKKVSKASPFPVLTFRIANEQHSIVGGEIINATVKAVALFESTRYDDEVSEELAKQISADRQMRTSKDTTKIRKSKLSKTPSDKLSQSVTATERTTTSDSSLDDSLNLSESTRRSLGEPDNALAILQNLNALTHKARWGKKMKIDDEEVVSNSSSKIVPRIVFTKLDLETSEFPLFKRIWRFKHHLNQDSPLLTSEAQKAIMENGGHWPWKWNNAEDVRNALQFKQMVVSFTGISNISGDAVYKQKVYSMADTAVGYQFVNVLYRGRRGNLNVDLRLINDVAEQTGGGGETLQV